VEAGICSSAATSGTVSTRRRGLASGAEFKGWRNALRLEGRCLAARRSDTNYRPDDSFVILARRRTYAANSGNAKSYIARVGR